MIWIQDSGFITLRVFESFRKRLYWKQQFTHIDETGLQFSNDDGDDNENNVKKPGFKKLNNKF